MLVFGKARRALLAKQLSDAANVAVAALIFGPFVSGRPFSPSAMLYGFAIWIGLAGLALAVAGKETRDC